MDLGTAVECIPFDMQEGMDTKLCIVMLFGLLKNTVPVSEGSEECQPLFYWLLVCIQMTW